MDDNGDSPDEELRMVVDPEAQAVDGVKLGEQSPAEDELQDAAPGPEPREVVHGGTRIQ